jgi:hypothetical protein
MPMPHEEMKRLIIRRLKGTDGAARMQAIEECMSMLPGYRQGPYADLRKWLVQQAETTRKKRKVPHAEETFVRNQGDARIVLLGPPNAGKSSILRALCGSRVEVGDYPFTTLRPIAAVALINGAQIQLVEIPGLVEGAREGRGHGRLYLGAAQDAQAFLLILPLEPEGVAGFAQALAEVEDVVGGRPALVVGTKSDLPEAGQVLAEACSRFPGHRVVAISVVNGQGIEDLRQAIWDMAGLIRVFSRQEKAESSGVHRPIRGDHASTLGDDPSTRGDRPFILPDGSTVEDLASRIHHGLSEGLDKAVLWGPSARFPGQTVGRQHVLQDGDCVELVRRHS